MLSNQFTPYNSANESTFQTIFLPEEYREGIFSIDEFTGLLNYIVANVLILMFLKGNSKY